MARGKKVVKRREKVVSRRRMLGDKEVFPIRVISRKAGDKYDFMGGFTREGRSDPVTVVAVSYTHLTLPTILRV